MDPVTTVAATIARHGLLDPGDTVVVAVSGGPDSVGLLEVLTRLAPAHGWQLYVASFDHRWRAASVLEGALVARLADERGWPWTVGCAGRTAFDEAGARRQRREFLLEVANDVGAAAIATGHTADDRVETLLFNLLRGTGLTGLAASGPRTACFIRPLVELPRQALREWVAGEGLPFCEDPTNLDSAHFRNRLRYELLPALETFWPGAGGRLRRTAAVLGSEAEVLDELAGLDLAQALCEPEPTDFLHGLDAVVVNLMRAPRYSRSRTRLFVRAALARCRGDLVDLGSAEIDALAALALGRADAGALEVGGGVAVRSGHRLVLLPEPYRLAPWGPLPVAGAERLGLPGGYTFVTGEAARRAHLQARVAADVLERSEVRSRRRGDALQPAGRRGSHSVSDLMTELRIPRIVRDRVPLLVCDDQVVWLPGVEVPERYQGFELVGLVCR